MLASTLFTVVIYGVLEVDFFCTLFLKIVVSWSTLRALAHKVPGWYFPDVLRTRQFRTGVLLGTYCCMVVQARIGSRSISY